MEITALAQSLSAQTAMGMLITKMLEQTQDLIQQQASTLTKQSMQVPASQEGIGENLDIVA